jgi:hydrogenase expression/formation protein HypE
LDGGILGQLGDSALLPITAVQHAGVENGRLALTTDSHVVSPLEYPGGDIGRLAVAGTVNDLAVAGAVPLYLTAGFILEEGFSLELLRKYVDSMAETAAEAGVQVAAGDTKVVPRGQADGMYINTAGVGIVPRDLHLRPEAVQPGDVLLINGAPGEHSVAVLATRAGLEFETPVLSDCNPLNELIAAVLADEAVRPKIRFMRDATRGGVVAVLKELAVPAGLDVVLTESSLPTTPGVQGACELLGLDPLYLVNEGKVIMAVAPTAAERALELMHSHPLGSQAARIGSTAEGSGKVLLKTRLGGTRRLEPLSGAPLPRIC